MPNAEHAQQHDQQHEQEEQQRQESNDTMWYPRADLTKEEVSKLQNMLGFVQEGIVRVNMMILTCSVSWRSCTWISHQDSVDAMLECASIHFLEVINVFLEYVRIGYCCPPCITDDEDSSSTRDNDLAQADA